MNFDMKKDEDNRPF